ncbi:hypothetical protein [Mannheimia indoligenes]|uniref:hypothetical protein n=1 Tax=Mannheimia indoligenes TaxID=3103145 RepID=UPI002FE575DB
MNYEEKQQLINELETFNSNELEAFLFEICINEGGRENLNTEEFKRTILPALF